MRQTFTMQPGIAGMNRDLASHLIAANESRRAQDAIVQEALLRQMKGWKYDGSVADAAADLISNSRNRFILADVTRSLTADATGTIRIHNDAAAGTTIFVGSVPYYPQGMYRDQEMWCANDGESPMLLYSGAGFQSSGAVTLAVFTTGKATVTASAGTFPASVVPGSYIAINAPNPTTIGIPPIVYARVLERVSATVLTLEDMHVATGGTVGSSPVTSGYGFTFPCVPVYRAGTISTTSDFTITGGFLQTGDWGTLTSRDGVLMPVAGGAGRWTVLSVSTVSTEDTFQSTYQDNTISNQQYAVLRRCPFRAAVAHRQGLFGTGVKPDPDVVYAAPQGWNPALPPGYVPPLDPAGPLSSDNPEDFQLFPIYVPSPYDGDANVALLSSPEGLRVLKGKSSHTIYGDYPNFSQRPWLPGIGCIDARSAKTLSFGLVWASREGVFLEAGSVENLTEGRERRGAILQDWRSIVDGFDRSAGDFCAIGERGGRMLVSIATDAGATHVCFGYERATGGWTCEVTRHKANFFFESKLPGESERLLWTSPETALRGRVMDSGPALDGTGIAKNGDGTSPRMQYESGTAIGKAAGIEGEVLLGDLSLHANVLDAGAAGATQMAVSVVHGGAADQSTANETKALDAILSDGVDRIDRHERTVNRAGRTLQIVVDVPTLGTNTAATKVELAQITTELFDSGVGT